MRCIILLAFGLSSSCTNGIDGSQFDRSCVVDDDCVMVPLDDPCSGCGSDALSVVGAEEAEEELRSAQAWCSDWFTSDCLAPLPAVCREGFCECERGPC